MRRIAVILGAGPGMGAALATRFAKTHSLLLLSRSLPGSFPRLNLDLPEDVVHAASSDGSRDSLTKAIKEVKAKWPDSVVDVGIFNNGGTFAPGKFLERTEQELRDGLESNVIAGFNFAQVLIPIFLSNTPDDTTGAKGTLIFTGATMALRGGAVFSAMAPGMFARRALSQSLAREFGPQRIHVAHVVVDGRIDTPKSRQGGGDSREEIEKRMDPAEMAQTYVSLVNQHKSAWTQELDLRPYCETF